MVSGSRWGGGSVAGKGFARSRPPSEFEGGVERNQGILVGRWILVLAIDGGMSAAGSGGDIREGVANWWRRFFVMVGSWIWPPSEVGKGQSGEELG